MADVGKMRETELYEPVRDWLLDAGWTVRAEVAGCDVAAVDGQGRLVLVELKTTLNFEVVLQAADRQRMADFVYVAVPARLRAMARKRWYLVTHLLKRLELGLLLVHFPQRGGSVRVEEAFPPVPFDRVRSRATAKRRRDALMREFSARSGDHNRGGSTQRALVTAYREEALFIAQCLEANGPAAPRALREMGTDAAKTTRILHDNHYGWFARVSRGLYGLTDAGAAALRQYAGVLADINAGKGGARKSDGTDGEIT